MKVKDLLEYTRYQIKAGGLEGKEAGKILTDLLSRQIGWVTFGYISQGVDERTSAILKAAGAFVLEIYAELAEG